MGNREETGALRRFESATSSDRRVKKNEKSPGCSMLKSSRATALNKVKRKT